MKYNRLLFTTPGFGFSARWQSGMLVPLEALFSAH
jgi:hypothetical protein